MKKKSEIKENDKLIFTSGNFEGLTGRIKETNFNSTNPNAIYGYYHEVILSNGKTGYIEKGEHWEFS
jgi:tRNA G37 N-methylase TrmD